MGDRSILHCDLNNFFASVELLGRPELRGLPVAVCGDPESRHGIILSKSEEAKRFGVKTAETIGTAKSKCPELILIRSSHGKYVEYSERVRKIFLSYTDRVEPFGIDEAWLDVTDLEILCGSAENIAYDIKERVKKELGLTLSVGVSFNKIFAKIGSDYKKPDAVTVLDRENYKDIIYPMSVDSMIFVGNKTRDALKRINIKTIGELAAVSREELIATFGKAGNNLYDIFSGASDDEVRSYYDTEEVKSVGNGQTFPRDISSEREVKKALLVLSERVSDRLRRAGKVCNCVKLTMKTPGFVSFDRQKKTDVSTDSTEKIYKEALSVFEASWKYGTKIRMLTVTVTGLSENGTGDQLSLMGAMPVENFEKYNNLDFAKDKLRQQFGGEIINSASLSVEMTYGDIE